MRYYLSLIFKRVVDEKNFFFLENFNNFSEFFFLISTKIFRKKNETEMKGKMEIFMVTGITEG